MDLVSHLEKLCHWAITNINMAIKANLSYSFLKKISLSASVAKFLYHQHLIFFTELLLRYDFESTFIYSIFNLNGESYIYLCQILIYWFQSIIQAYQDFWTLLLSWNILGNPPTSVSHTNMEKVASMSRFKSLI